MIASRPDTTLRRDRQRLVRPVKLVGELGITAYQERGKTEQLDLFRGDIAGPGVAQIVQQPALRRPGVEERVSHRSEVALSQERRNHRDGEEEEQPGHVDQQSQGEGDQGDQVLHRSEELGEQADASHRLPAGPLQPVIGLRILELLQVEAGGMLHELNAGPVGEEIAQQALVEGGHPGQCFADQGNPQLDDSPAMIRRSQSTGWLSRTAAQPTG